MLLGLLIGGLIGYLLGGGAGLLFGAIIGYALAYWPKVLLLRRGLNMVQGQFLQSTFAVMGMMCKADGQVTDDEIQAAEQIFDRLHLSGERRDTAKAAFNRGKASDFDLDAEIRALRRATRDNRSLLQLFMQVQLWAIAADGQLHEEERQLLLRVARALDLPDEEVQRLEAMLHGGAAGRDTSARPSLDEAYEVLGVDSSSSDAEVKKAYRRQMNRNHPDKLASQGMPEDMREVAEERTREIQKAYETITAARQRST